MGAATLVHAKADGFYRRDVLTDPAVPFVYRETIPSLTTVGLSNPSALKTPVTQDVTISSNGATYTNEDFRCVVNFTGSGNKLVNCRVSGRTVTSYPGSNGWVNFAQQTGNIMERCEISGSPNGGATDNGTQYHNGTVGSGFTLDRCYLWGVNDGVYHGLTGESTVKGCLFDYLRFTLDDGAHGSDTRVPGWSHNDPIQWRAGAMHIYGNMFMGRFHPTMGDGAGAAGLTTEGKPKWWNLHGVIINPNTGNLTGEIDDNWFWGGENAILGATAGGPSAGHPIMVRRNRIVDNQCISYGNHHVQINVPTSYGVTFEDNIFWNHTDTTPARRGLSMSFADLSGSMVSRID